MKAIKGYLTRNFLVSFNGKLLLLTFAFKVCQLINMEIQRLNMDNSWLLSFAGQKILIDPWLKGAEIDFFSWFNKQTHRTKPLGPAEINTYDWVLITQKYPDHFHPETLIDLNPKRIMVPNSILKKVKKLLPNAEVIAFNESPIKVFNSSINVSFLSSPKKIDPIYDALLLDDEKESIFVATHGYLNFEHFKPLFHQKPAVKLAFAPFNKYELPAFLGGLVAPGLEGVSKLMEYLNPSYIVATHDEDKLAEGLVSKFAKITWSPNTEKLQAMPHLKNKYLAISDYKTYTL